LAWRHLLGPLWRNPTHPAVVAADSALFADRRSPWAERFLRASNTYELLETPMLALPGFRARLLLELGDKRRAGVLKIGPDGTYSGGAGIRPSGPFAPKPGTDVVFRVCDFYAHLLSPYDGAPAFELYWPEAERDRGVAAVAAYLKQYGHRFTYPNAVEPPREE